MKRASNVSVVAALTFLLALPGPARAQILVNESFESGGPCYGLSCFTGGRVLNPPGGCASHSWQSGQQWCQQELPTGGWNGTRGVRLVMRQGASQFDMGWYFSDGKTPSWQNGDMVVWRFRIRYDNNFRWDGSGSQQQKMSNMAPGSTGPAPHRIVIQNERGGYTAASCTPLGAGSGSSSRCTDTGAACTSSAQCGSGYQCIPPDYDTAHGGFKVAAGIATPCAGPVKMTYGTWYHVQVAIRSSSSGSGFMKIWVNNNNLLNPNAQITGITFYTTLWGGGASFGNFWTDPNNNRSQGWVVDDLVLATTLDPAWYPSGAGSDAGPPDAAPPDAAPPDAAPPDAGPPPDLPPPDLPPPDLPPPDLPLPDAPPSDAPPTDAPPTDAPPTHDVATQDLPATDSSLGADGIPGADHQPLFTDSTNNPAILDGGCGCLLAHRPRQPAVPVILLVLCLFCAIARATGFRR